MFIRIFKNTCRLEEIMARRHAVRCIQQWSLFLAGWHTSVCGSRLLLRKPCGGREGLTTIAEIREATYRCLDRHEIYRVAKHVRPVLSAWPTHLCEIEFYWCFERRCCQ